MLGATKRPLQLEQDPASGAADPSPKPKKERSTLDKSLAESFKIKTEYLATMTSAESLATQMQDDPSWQWARPVETRGPFDKALDLLKKNRSQFVFDITSMKPQEIRKNYSDETLILESSKYNKYMPDLLQEVKLQSDMLLRMHASRLCILNQTSIVQPAKSSKRSCKKT